MNDIIQLHGGIQHYLTKDVEGIEGRNQNNAIIDRIQLRTKKSAEDNGTELY